MSYKVKVTPHGEGSFYRGGFETQHDAEVWAKSYKEKGGYTFVKTEVMKESKMKLVESKQFDKTVRSKLKKMLEAKVSVAGAEAVEMSPEEIENLKSQGVEYSIVEDDINTEVDKETWAEPKEEPVEQPVAEPEKEVDNSGIITIDDEEEDSEPEDIVDFLTKNTSDEVKPDEPAVLSEFEGLSNEEKKALLLKLAKEDNDLDAILKMYMDKKCPIKTNEELESEIVPEKDIEPIHEPEQIQEPEPVVEEPEKAQWKIKNFMGMDATFYGTEEEAHKYANKIGGEATRVEAK